MDTETIRDQHAGATRLRTRCSSMSLILSLNLLLLASSSIAQTSGYLDESRTNAALEAKLESLDGKLARLSMVLDSLALLRQQAEAEESLPGLISEKSIIRFGLSIGHRRIVSDKFVDPSITPMDSLLRLDKKNKNSIVLSGVVSVAPFKNWLSFVANINFADLSNEGSTTISSKKIDGGIGLGFELHENFAIALTYERVFIRELRQSIQDQFQNQKLVVNGTVLNELNRDNDNLFRDDNKSAWALRFIYYF